ncbi:MAG: 30S ribosomal protein THX [Lewinellaceae bacterium]|nr:30S ribosomal protein THX [Lewinellaceae bacterium]
MGKGDKKTKKGKRFRGSYGKFRSKKKKARIKIMNKGNLNLGNEEKLVRIWEPISINDRWLNADTSFLDDILPSWYRKREELLTGNKDYEDFLNRLKRQHAIETGVVEKLYDLNEGITQTFIKEGFVESYLQHGDTNISPKKLMAHLKDHFEAIDFVFDLVKNERPLTKSFIKQLHQLLTQNQETTDAINSLGQIVQVKLLRGEFKQHPNNPKRGDGTTYAYCPPLQVEAEMDKLLESYNDLLEKSVNSVIISSWFHHAFTQIHPFQDGNGRVARLLSSLILIKDGLFPLTIRRDDKVKYINALELADNGSPGDLVKLFSELQKKNIEGILNWKTTTFYSLKDAATVLSKKVESWQSQQQKRRQEALSKNRKTIFDISYDISGRIKDELFGLIPKDKARIFLQSVYPNDENHYWYTRQIVDYAKMHDYFFNKSLPRGWFKFGFKITENLQYNLIITLHHYSYDDAILAIGGFLEFKETQIGDNGETIEDSSVTPIQIDPFTISLEADSDKLKKNIETYIRDLVTVGVSHIANEIG